MTTLTKELIIPPDTIVLPAPNKLVFEELHYKVAVNIGDNKIAYLYLSKSDLDTIKKQSDVKQ